MRVWMECYEYNRFDIMPNSMHRSGDMGIVRCSHLCHSHSDGATYELQHQKGPVWFDRVTDQRKSNVPKMESGDILISCVGSDNTYNNPEIAYINRIDDRRVHMVKEPGDHFPAMIMILNQSEIDIILDHMINNDAVGFPREDTQSFSGRVPEPAYEIDPVIHNKRAMIIIDARTTAKPWQKAYMKKKMEPCIHSIRHYLSVVNAVNGHDDKSSEAKIWYLCTGLDLVRNDVVRNLSNTVSDLFKDKDVNLKFSYRVWSSFEFAYHVRAYPEMMKRIIEHWIKSTTDIETHYQ